MPDVPAAQSPERKICKLSGYTRDRRGCLTCRRRKKKCSAPRPDDTNAEASTGGPSNPIGTPAADRCWPCTRLNLRCVWEDERPVPEPNQRPAHRNSLIVRPPPATHLSHEGLTNAQQHHRDEVLNYYVHSFAGSLSTNDRNNGFLSVLLPMAFESPPLMDSIVAWSTSHLALKEEKLRVKALEDRSAALTSFAGGLRDLSRETCLAICLVLTSMEAILGNTEDWYNHLHAAATIISGTTAGHSVEKYGNDDLNREGDFDNRKVRSSLAATSEGQWLLRNFAYHDILASVSLGKPMLVPQLEWLEDHDIVDTYLGVGCQPMRLLGQVNVLSNELATHGFTRLDAATAISQLRRLERDLLTWTAGTPTPDTTALAALAESYQGAALICIYRTLRHHRLADPPRLAADLAAAVTRVVACLDRLRPGAAPECTLLFPLFMAGGETADPAQQEIIAARMEAVAGQRSFENIRVALDVLREVWAVRARTVPVDPARPYDWSCVLERRKWSLALS